MKCKVCDIDNKVYITGQIFSKYQVEYFLCKNFSFLYTEELYCLDEAYEYPINISDVGYIQRNIYLSQKLTILLVLFFNENGKYLDYAGGYGVFVRCMRDIGFDFYWDDKYTANIFSRGFEYNPQDIFEAVTTFESFEHFVDPIKEIENLLSYSKNIIFSTELLPNPITNDWWYLGSAHGQHISFYSEQTFLFIAKKYKLYYVHLDGLHLLSKKKISNFKLKHIKLSKFGLHKILQKKLKSKIWTDYTKLYNF